MTQKDQVLASVISGLDTVKHIQANTGISHEGTVRRELMELKRLGRVRRVVNKWVAVSAGDQTDVIAPAPQEVVNGSEEGNSSESF